MADSAASSQSRTARARSTKRRSSTVSTETENKLARAARSAQRLAQLSDASRDDSTLDMFPDDPTRATLEAMNIDIRQGTLHGFELPDVVLAAVGVPVGPDSAAGASSDARAARRAPREKTEAAYASVPLAGFERIEPTHHASEPADEPANAAGSSGSALGAASAVEPQISQPVAPTLVSPSMAAASLVRSVTARRQEASPTGDPAVVSKPGGVPPQRLAAANAQTPAALCEANAASGEASDDAAVTSAAVGQVKPELDDPAGVVKASAITGVDRAAAAAAAVAAATRAVGMAVAPATAGAATTASASATTKAIAGATAATAALAAKAPNAATASTATGGVAGAMAAKAATAATGTTEAKTVTAATGTTAAKTAAGATGATAAKAAAGATGTTAVNAANVANTAIAADSPRPATPPRPNAPFAAPLHEAAPTAPELDRARATAFADTVDALYGVISDQRRAATDHSRRMKWMLSIVVGALLMTVAIGITQTVLLMRLTRETTAQQHRIEQMMQNQQAAMTSLLDAHLAMANTAAAMPSAASTPAATSHQVAAVAAVPVSKRKAHTHAHKPKVAPSH